MCVSVLSDVCLIVWRLGWATCIYNGSKLCLPLLVALLLFKLLPPNRPNPPNRPPSTRSASALHDEAASLAAALRWRRRVVLTLAWLLNFFSIAALGLPEWHALFVRFLSFLIYVQRYFKISVNVYKCLHVLYSSFMIGGHWRTAKRGRPGEVSGGVPKRSFALRL